MRCGGRMRSVRVRIRTVKRCAAGLTSTSASRLGTARSSPASSNFALAICSAPRSVVSTISITATSSSSSSSSLWAASAAAAASALVPFVTAFSSSPSSSATSRSSAAVFSRALNKTSSLASLSKSVSLGTSFSNTLCSVVFSTNLPSSASPTAVPRPFTVPQRTVWMRIRRPFTSLWWFPSSAAAEAAVVRVTIGVTVYHRSLTSSRHKELMGTMTRPTEHGAFATSSFASSFAFSAAQQVTVNTKSPCCALLGSFNDALSNAKPTRGGREMATTLVKGASSVAVRHAAAVATSPPASATTV